MIDYDLELRHHHSAFRRALEIARTDQVLDIGCGAGETTREAARLASAGAVLGVDRSEAMIQRARSLTLAEGLSNVEYECADIERHAFGARRFDLAISRFGTMFFADPCAAFTGIRSALTAHGRLAMIVWQGREQNEWAVELERAVAGDTPSTPASLQPFSLGAPRAVQHILHAAGFAEIAFAEVHGPVFYGADPESAYAFVSQFLFVQEALRNSADRAPALERLRTLLAGHHTRDGVCFESRAWIITARCAALPGGSTPGTIV